MRQLIVNTGANAHILQNDPGMSYPVEDQIYVLGGAEDEWIRGLLALDFGALPNAAEVTLATLAIFRDEEIPQYLAGEQQVHRLLGEFDAQSATWSERASGVEWSVPGGDFVASPAAVLGGGSGQYVTADVTALLAAARAAQLATLSLLIRSVAEGDPPDNPRTYRAFGQSNPPVLTIAYTLPAGATPAHRRMGLGLRLGL